MICFYQVHTVIDIQPMVSLARHMYLQRDIFGITILHYH